jgi:hypothetical protein
MGDVELITDDFVRVSELDIDLAGAIYERFFDSCEAAVPLMGNSDIYMRGRMLEQVYELFMDENHEGEGGYLRWEVDNHLDAYNVDVSMYESFLHAVKDATKAVLHENWGSQNEHAWDSRIDALLKDIHAHAQHKVSA